MKTVIITACLHFYRPAIPLEHVPRNLYSAASLHVYTHRIFNEPVVGDTTIRNIFQQNTISTGTPIPRKKILFHSHIPGIHHGNASAIISKNVPDITIAMRKHKVQAVANILFADIVLYC